MKKIISLFLILATALTLFACTKKAESDGKLKIIATIFPAYDFAHQVSGENADVSMLLPTGTESHGYEPTAKDIIKIQECDLFIYNGGESDVWVDEVLKAMDKKPPTLKMTDCVSAVSEKITEGMEAQSDGEADEHVWTSPKNAIKLTQAICAAICDADTKNSGVYEKNALDYIEKLQTLDRGFEKYFSSSENNTMIFGDRFPLSYFAEEYGLDCYAAFPGCAAETEASSKTISFLIDKAKTTEAKMIFYIELSTHKIADTIAAEAGAQTVLFHTCHNVSKEDFENGESYFSLMSQNLERLQG